MYNMQGKAPNGELYYVMEILTYSWLAL